MVYSTAIQKYFKLIIMVFWRVWTGRTRLQLLLSISIPLLNTFHWHTNRELCDVYVGVHLGAEPRGGVWASIWTRCDGSHDRLPLTAQAVPRQQPPVLSLRVNPPTPYTVSHAPACVSKLVCNCGRRFLTQASW